MTDNHLYRYALFWFMMVENVSIIANVFCRLTGQWICWLYRIANNDTNGEWTKKWRKILAKKDSSRFDWLVSAVFSLHRSISFDFAMTHRHRTYEHLQFQRWCFEALMLRACVLASLIRLGQFNWLNGWLQSVYHLMCSIWTPPFSNHTQRLEWP